MLPVLILLCSRGCLSDFNHKLLLPSKHLQHHEHHHCVPHLISKQNYQELAIVNLQQYIAWGCVFAKTQSSWGCVFAASTRLGAVYLQNTQSVGLYLQQHRALGCVLGLCIWNNTKQFGLRICSKDEAWGCVFAASTKLMVVYLQQTQSLRLCISNKHKASGCVFAMGTKLWVVYLKQY